MPEKNFSEPPGEVANEQDTSTAAIDNVHFQTPAVSKITIDGDEITYDISSITLEQSISSHHVLQLRIRRVGVASGSEEFEDHSRYTGFLGKPISLEIKPEGEIVSSSARLQFIGLVTEVRLESTIDGINTVLLKAHSPTIALDSLKKRKRFSVEQNCDDIVGSILSNYDITVGNLDRVPVSFESGTINSEVNAIVQFNETDYAFIRRLASEHGLFAFYDGTAFNVEKARSNNTQDLEWRITLGAFSLGMGTGPLKYTAKVWDPKKKEAVECESDRSQLRSALTNLSQTVLDGSEKIYKTKGVSLSPKHTVQANADKVVTRETESAVSRLMMCDGISIVPALQVGSSIKISGMGDIDGEYWIRKIVHSLNDSGQYHNRFVCSPLELSFPSLLGEKQPYFHLQTGVVTDNNDPEGIGRVKVRLSWNSSNEETEFIRVLTPDGGGERGWFMLPEVGDEVLVGYERGNPDVPVVLGCLYNGMDKPPMSSSDVLGDGVETKLFRTRSGNEIIFYDKGGSEKITISQKDGKNVIVLDMSGPSITITSDGDISMKAANISLESTSGDITMKAGNKIVAESTADMQLKAGGNFKSEGSMNYEAKGGIGFKASGTQANLEGSAMTTIKGAIVKIN